VKDRTPPVKDRTPPVKDRKPPVTHRTSPVTHRAAPVSLCSPAVDHEATVVAWRGRADADESPVRVDSVTESRHNEPPVVAEERMRRFLVDKRFGLIAFAGLAAGAACTPDFDTSRNPAPTGTVGEEVFGVLCDRVGAQALPEDLTGGSFNGICHKSASGTWSSLVDPSGLPPVTSGLKTASGEPVSMAAALASRSHGVARIEALAKRRTDLIGALDATFPAISIAIKDTANTNPALSCLAAPHGAKDPLSHQLADLLGRFTKLYDDGTIPQSTESFARVLDAFSAQKDAQEAYSHFNARQGYRPMDIALGVVRPMLAYPDLRDFTNTTLDLLSSTGNVYAGAPAPGAAYAQLQSLLGATYQELRTTSIGAPLGIETASGLDPLGRAVLSRPWDNLEFLQQIFYAQDPTFGGGASQYIVARDPRGYALVPLVSGAVPAPFVDKDGDGLPDVNDLGQFITTGGESAPTPFFSFDGPAAPAKDAYGRAMTSATGSLYYGYIDTSHVYAASLMDDLQAFADPVPADAHETLMNALAGAYVLMGSRKATEKTYAPDPSLAQEWSLTHGLGQAPANVGTTPVQLAYSGFDGSSSPMLDLVYALGNVLADKTNDDVFAYTNALLAQDVGMVARLAGTGLTMQAHAKSHPEAKIPAKSTFWDELIDVTIQIEQEPGLLEDVLAALGNDNSLLIPNTFAAYNQYKDAITYDTSNLNGPPVNLSAGGHGTLSTPVDRSMPDTGANRSAFQRFTGLIHDTDGLTVCNKAGANVVAQIDIVGQVTLPLLGGSFDECAVFKIDNAAAFYLDSIIGKADLYLRDDTLRNGYDILGFSVGAATVGLMEDSSGINGFWDDSGSTTLRPTPQFLDRQMFFDQKNDSPNPGDPNYLTNYFLANLTGPNTGATVCPERIITDPCASSSSNCTDAPDIASDGLVHGLRACTDGQWLIQRDPNTIFVWEDESFYQAMTPVITAFANHNREDLFISLMETLDRHWADHQGTASECLLSVDPAAKYKNCTGDGLVTYEPLLVQQYTSDLIPALHDLVAILKTLTVPHCDSIDPSTHGCTPTQVDGISVMASTLRSLFDPNLAAAAGLKDRRGNITGLRNDGMTNPQVTRLYLLLEALNGIDAAFADYATKNPKDAERQTAWRSARSQIVDQFFTITGSGTSSSFADPAIPKILPVVVNALRSQLVAHCPGSFNAPYPPCAWAGQELVSHMQETVNGPLFAGTMDLTDAIRKDEAGRQALERLLTYLLDSASGNQARAILFGAADDMFQVLADDPNLVPFYHVLAEAARPSVETAGGVVVQKGVADAQMGLLARVAGRAMIASGSGKPVENCSAELDPNQVLSIALTHVVTPMKTGDKAGETPLEVMLDVVDSVNRAAPQDVSQLDAADYASISNNVSEFLLDKQRGMEQFYEVVRLGTE
jgi:hypothetical protein